MTELNPLAVQNAALLRELIKVGHDRAATVADLAARLGRDKSNLHKTLKAMAEAGLIDAEARALTDAGADQLAAILRAEGQAAPDPAPTGYVAGDQLALHHGQILPDPDNARRDWDSEDAVADLAALANDIAANGLLQNLVVRPEPHIEARGGRPTYVLVGGERRWRAISRLIGEGVWPADRPIPARILATDPLGIRLAALSENLQRRALNPIEEATAYLGLRDAGLSTEAIADRVGLTRRHVQMRLQLLDLTEDQRRRMTLPDGDPERLSISEARQLVRNLEGKRKAREKWEAELSPRQRLILAEIRIASPSGYMFDRVEVDGPVMAQDADAEALDKAGLICIPTTRDAQGKTLTRCDQAAWEVCQALFPDGPAASAAKLRTELGHPEPDEGRFTVDWLNGPFEIPADVIAEVEADKAEQAARIERAKAQNAEAARARQAAEERHAMGRTHAQGLLAKAAHAPAAPTIDDLPTLARTLDRPLPWRATTEAEVLDADDELIIDCHPQYRALSDADVATAMLTAVAVNSAAGLETPPLLDVEAEANAEAETAEGPADLEEEN